VWDLTERKLHTIIKATHGAAVTCLHFFPGEPVLMSAGADNAVHHWIFDNADGSARQLRGRAGHAAPPRCVRFYGEEGNVLLTAAGDRSVRAFSTIQDQQSRELSQVRAGCGLAQCQCLRAA
jgi:U3 small nucleolar RNA-associated protein 21